MWKKVVTLSVLVLAATLFLHQSQSAVTAQTNLVNPSFEEPYNSGVANGWAPWHEDSNEKKDCNTERYAVRPVWSPEFNPDLILDSTRSMHVGNQFDTWRGGVFQTVNVTPGETYRFSAWANGRGSNEQYPLPSDFAVNFRFRVGIDPAGNGVWTANSIVWSGAVSPHDNWQQVAVETVAQTDKITVFLEGDFTGLGQCRAHLDIWFDKAELVTTGPPPTATSAPLPTLPPPPPATATPIPSPTPIPTETPIPSPTPTATPAGGAICINTFNDANGDGQNNDNAGYMAGVRYVIAQNNATVRDGVSSGTATPVCFNDLVPGDYQVAQFLPEALEMTTAGNINLTVNVGDAIGLDFGSRIKAQTNAPVIADSGNGSSTSTDTATTTDTGTTADSGSTAVDTATDQTQTQTDTTGGAVIEQPADSGGLLGQIGVWEIAAISIMGLAVILLGVVVFLLLRQQGPNG